MNEFLQIKCLYKHKLIFTHIEQYVLRKSLINLLIAGKIKTKYILLIKAAVTLLSKQLISNNCK